MLNTILNYYSKNIRPSRREFWNLKKKKSDGRIIKAEEQCIKQTRCFERVMDRDLALHDSAKFKERQQFPEGRLCARDLCTRGCTKFQILRKLISGLRIHHPRPSTSRILRTILPCTRIFVNGNEM